MSFSQHFQFKKMSQYNISTLLLWFLLRILRCNLDSQVLKDSRKRYYEYLSSLYKHRLFVLVSIKGYPIRKPMGAQVLDNFSLNKVFQ